MDITPVQSNSVATALNGETSGTLPSQEYLGANDFFKLLTVQLSNQNPLEPMKDTDFIAQMSTFSSLEQMKQLNATMSQFSDEQRIVNAQAFLGKSITYQDASGQDASFLVNSVTLENGKLLLHGADQTIEAGRVTGSFLPDPESNS